MSKLLNTNVPILNILNHYQSFCVILVKMGTVALGSSCCRGKWNTRGFECKRDGPGRITKTFWASIDWFTCETGIITSTGPLLNPRAGMSSYGERGWGPEADETLMKAYGTQANSYEARWPFSAPLHGTWYHPGVPKTRSCRSTRQWLPGEERVKNQNRISTVKLTEWTGTRRNFILFHFNSWTFQLWVNAWMYVSSRDNHRKNSGKNVPLSRPPGTGEFTILDQSGG